MKLDEVRAGLVACLRDMPDQDVAAWEGIAAKLARVMSPAVGWRLAGLIHELASADALDSDLSAIAGLVKALQRAGVEKAKADKLASRKGKATP